MRSWHVLAGLLLAGALTVSLGCGEKASENKPMTKVLRKVREEVRGQIGNKETTVSKAPQSLDDWVKYESTKDGFRILFPGRPEVSDYEVLRTHVRNYAALIEGMGAYNVHVGRASVPIDPNAQLKGSMSIYGENASLISSEKRRFGDYPALDYEYRANLPDAVLFHKGAIIQVGSATYSITVVCTAKTKNLAYANYRHFLESFQLFRGNDGPPNP